MLMVILQFSKKREERIKVEILGDGIGVKNEKGVSIAYESQMEQN